MLWKKRWLSYGELYSRARRVAGVLAGLGVEPGERVGFSTFFTFTHQHQNFYKIVRQAEFVDEDLFRLYYQKLAEGYKTGLAQAMESGEIRRLDVECLAYCLMGISDFLGMRWVLWNDETPPEDIFESMLSFIRHGMDNRPAPDGDGRA